MRTRNKLSVILFFVMLTVSAIVLRKNANEVLASESRQVEILEIGDFEADESGNRGNWIARNAKNEVVDIETCYKNDPEKAAHGNSYLELGEGVKWVGYKMNNKFVSGKEYKAVAYLRKTPDAEGKLYPCIRFDFQTGDSETRNYWWDFKNKLTETDQWVEFETTFTAPENIGSNGDVYLYLWKNNSDAEGILAFDHVRVYTEETVDTQLKEILEIGDFEADESGNRGNWIARNAKNEVVDIETCYKNDPEKAAHGSSYLELGEGVKWVGYKMNNKFVSGKEYKAVAYLRKTPDAEGKLYPCIRFDFQTGDSETRNYWWDFKNILTETDQWVEFETTFTAPENIGSNGDVYLYLWKNNSDAEGILAFDHVRVYTEDDGVEPILSEADIFRKMLEDEKAVSQMVAGSNTGSGTEKPSINGINYVKYNDFKNTAIQNLGHNDNVIGDAVSNGWFARAKFAASAAIVAEGHGDDSALSITYTPVEGENVANPWIYQDIADMSADVEYQLSYWYKIPETTTSSVPYVKIESFSDPDLAGVGGIYYDGIDIRANEYIRDGQWHKVVKSFTINGSASVIRVMPRLSGSEGTVYLDDIELWITKSALKLDTGYKFFYKDELQETEFSIDAGNSLNGKESTVDFQVYDGKTLVWESKDISINNGTANVRFPLAVLQKSEVPYCVKATVKNSDGSEYGAVSENIFMTTRPEYLRKDGVILANGTTAIYPVIGYHADKGTYEKVKEAGINVVMLSPTNHVEMLEKLNQCEEVGLKAIVGLYCYMKPAGEDSNIELTIDIVSNEEIMNHPALLCYSIADEAFLHDASAEMNMENSYRLVRKYDKKHPITHVECYMKNIEKSVKYGDVLVVDPYDEAATQYVYQFVDETVNAMDGRPVYTIVQTFGGSTYGSQFPFPKASDARNNIWQAFLGGSDAIGYYSINDAYMDENVTLPIWDVEEGKVWNALVEFEQKEKNIAYDRFIYKNAKVISENVMGEDYGYSCWEAGDGTLYLLILGKKAYEEKADVSISIAEIAGKKAECVAGAMITDGNGEKYLATIQNDVFSTTVKGVDTILYKLTKASESEKEPDQVNKDEKNNAGDLKEENKNEKKPTEFYPVQSTAAPATGDTSRIGIYLLTGTSAMGFIMWRRLRRTVKERKEHGKTF